jgi:hypothetical protein
MVECAPNENEPIWQPALTALRQAFEQLKFDSLDVEVILSNRFMRYALLPWTDAVKTHAEMVSLSRIQFENLFGPIAKEWHVQSDMPVYGQPGMACALDSALLASLRSLSSERRLRLVSVQPHLMLVINRWRQRFGRNALILLAESAQCIFLSLREGMLHSVRTVKLNELNESELQVAIDREILFQGLDAKVPVYLHALGSQEVTQLRQAFNLSQLELSPTSVKQAPGLTMLACRGS